MAFTKLALEINCMIASHLNDDDLKSFAATCSATFAVTADSSPVWRMKFQQEFDLPSTLPNKDLKSIYKHRKVVLKRSTKFTNGRTNAERECMMLLRSLMLESTGSSHGSKNLETIKAFASSNDILQNVCSYRYTTHLDPFLATVQVMLAHVQFDLSLKLPVFGFQDSQAFAYQHPMGYYKDRLFIGTKVNMKGVLHLLNFFKYHITRKVEATLYEPYAALETPEQIKAWRQKLKPGSYQLGTHWKGVHGYLDWRDLDHLREFPNGTTDLQDNFFEEDEDFPTMDFRFTDPQSEPFWPTDFEDEIESLSHVTAQHGSRNNAASTTDSPSRNTRSGTRTRVASPTEANACPAETVNNQASSRNQHFIATGMDTKEYIATGWLNALGPQQGIPGFKRITMVKLCPIPEDVRDLWDDTTEGITAALDMATEYMDEMWGYEGVVLPGGEIIVGRWWALTGYDDFDDPLSGPFLFWCTDENAVEDSPVVANSVVANPTVANAVVSNTVVANVMEECIE